MENQKLVIKNHLLRHKKITSWEAIMKYRITRLSSIIHRLRKSGMSIDSKRIDKDGSNYTLYKI